MRNSEITPVDSAETTCLLEQRLANFYYKSYAIETANPGRLEIEILPENSEATEDLKAFRNLSYSIYSTSSGPESVVPTFKKPNGTVGFYIIAKSDHLSEHMSPIGSLDTLPLAVQEEFAGRFGNLAGAYYIEIAKPDTLPDGTVEAPHIEASTLIDYSWENKPVVEIAQLSFNHLLTSEIKMDVGKQIHMIGTAVSQEIMNGEDFDIVAIMAPHVIAFVRAARVKVSPLGGDLRWHDAEVAQRIFRAYARYWGTEDTPKEKRPQLCHVTPYSLDDRSEIIDQLLSSGTK